jgi:hypothetical protein
LQATALKVNDCDYGINPMTNTGSKLRNLMTMVAILALGLMLRPSAVLAKAHRKSEGWRSDAAAISHGGHGTAILPVILPPPDEPPPPPPPSEDLRSEYSSDESAGDFGRSVNLRGFNAEAGCAERVLDLPQLLAFHDHVVATAHPKHQASPFDDYDELRPRDYSDDDNTRIEPSEDELLKDYDPNVQAPSATWDSSRIAPLRGGFVPLDPHGITVRPGDRSPIPPTSPLLTPPPGTAAMPFGGRR